MMPLRKISSLIEKDEAMHILPILCSLLIIGCSHHKGSNTANTEKPRVEEFSHGDIRVTVTIDPPRVHLDRDLLVTISVTGPPHSEARFSITPDRFGGFHLAGSMDGEKITTASMIKFEKRILLTPLVSSEYRIAPIAVTYTDHSADPPAEKWFPTKPVILDPEPLMKGSPPEDIVETLTPVWIAPSAVFLAKMSVLLLITAALAFGVWRLIRHIRRAIRLRKMSPKERALHELEELLAVKLVEKGKIKEFYLRLTMIVRMYIERAHGIRAPEQTTEEFLAAASTDKRFEPHVLSRLKAFLEAADLVKFAAHRPTPDAIANAITTAREYIQTDAAAVVPGGR